MFPDSLRTRLIFGAAVWVSIGMAVSAFMVSRLFGAVVTAQFDHDLVDHLDELAALVISNPAGRPAPAYQLSDARFLRPLSGLYWQVRSDGAVARSPSLDSHELPDFVDAKSDKPAQVAVPIGTMRIMQKLIDTSGAAAPLKLSVGVDDRLIAKEMGDIVVFIAVSFAIIALGLIGAACAQVEFGLRPLTRIRTMLAAVRSGASDNLPSDLPNEILPLVADLNGLITANRQMVQRARLQAGKFAHAMKTPLTVVIDEARSLAKKGHTEAAKAIIEQCLQMRLQIDYQTARARASARENPGAVTKVGPILGEVVAALSQLDRYRSIEITLSKTEDLDVAGDPQDLYEIFGNIIDNGAKWARTRVNATIRAGHDRVCVCIEDDGPGIPPEHRERVFNVGERLDPSATGSGLGLAIARDLATLYGGAVWIDGSDLGGAAVHIEIPGAASGSPIQECCSMSSAAEKGVVARRDRAG